MTRAQNEPKPSLVVPNVKRKPYANKGTRFPKQRLLSFQLISYEKDPITMKLQSLCILLFWAQFVIRGVQGINRRDVFYSVVRKDLEIAKCQASCQQYYSQHSQSPVGPNLHCWNTCQSLFLDPGHMPHVCGSQQLCPEPCQVACANLAHGLVIKTSDSDPKIMLPPVLSNCTLMWREPTTSGNHQTPKVPQPMIEAESVYLYVVYSKDHKGKWKRLTKTTRTTLSISKATLEAIRLIKVVGISGTGFVGDSTIKVKLGNENVCLPVVQRLSYHQSEIVEEDDLDSLQNQRQLFLTHIFVISTCSAIFLFYRVTVFIIKFCRKQRTPKDHCLETIESLENI